VSAEFSCQFISLSNVKFAISVAFSFEAATGSIVGSRVGLHVGCGVGGSVGAFVGFSVDRGVDAIHREKERGETKYKYTHL